MRFLLDSHLPHALASTLQRWEVDAVHLAIWRDGVLLHEADENILVTSTREQRILVTADRSTVTDLLGALWQADFHHAGVIFVDPERFPHRDIGRVARAILNVEQTMQEAHWTDLAVTLVAVDPTV
ncbi:MAG: DUF5615 family PIN-like protein [Dehalococcoidia bacterium]|nr:DUF5615 family PIN-like protein [Dehalococcoidia bacterium]